jgi:hypothetical protein
MVKPAAHQMLAEQHPGVFDMESAGLSRDTSLYSLLGIKRYNRRFVDWLLANVRGSDSAGYVTTLWECYYRSAI